MLALEVCGNFVLHQLQRLKTSRAVGLDIPLLLLKDTRPIEDLHLPRVGTDVAKRRFYCNGSIIYDKLAITNAF